MRRKTYLLVFPGAGPALIEDGLFGAFLGQVLEQGDVVYSIDGNVAVLITALGIETLTTRLKQKSKGADQFFIADISNSDRAGKMVPKFWKSLRENYDAEVA